MQQTYVCITCFLNLNFTATTLAASLWQACPGTIDSHVFILHKRENMIPSKITISVARSFSKLKLWALL
jgi:hypothetical protein